MNFIIRLYLWLLCTLLLSILLLLLNMREKCEQVFVIPFLVDYGNAVVDILHCWDNCFLFLSIVSVVIKMDFSLG